MNQFSPPRIIRWTSFLFLFFMLLMSAFRLFFFYYFKPSDVSFYQSLPSFRLGVRYDARVAAVILLPLLVIGSLSLRSWNQKSSKQKLFGIVLCAIPALLILLIQTDFSDLGRVVQKLIIGLIVSGFLFMIIILKDWNPFHNSRSKRFWLWWLGIASLAVLLFYSFDFYYYAYLTQRLNSNLLNFMDDAGISFRMMWQSYPVVKGLLLLTVLFLLLLWIVRKIYNISRTDYHSSKANRIISFTIVFIFLGICIYGKLERFPLRWSDAFAIGNNYEANLALNPFQSFFSSLSFRRSDFDLKKVDTYYPVMAKYLGVKDPDIKSLNFARVYAPVKDSIKTRPNIVLVICESFSAYKSSMWNNPLNTTPFFDSLTRQGLFFNRCFTPAFGTARGVWATITGVPDVQLVKTASRNPRAVDQQTIINNFEDYDKFYFLGGNASWANIRGLITNNIKGVHLYEENDYSAPKIDVWGISDMNLFLESNKILAKQQKPFFAIIQTSDNHRPYTIPKVDIGVFKKITGIPPDTLRKYGFETLDEYNAFRYTDYCYEKFMEAARKEKYMENTLFVFVGDHGIRSKYPLPLFPKPWVDEGLSCEHVPLLFYYPRLLKPKKDSTIASQLDILPTIASILNMAYTNTGMGKNLYNEPGGDHYAFIIDHDTHQIGVVHDNYYFVRSIRSKTGEFVSIVNNDPVPKNPSTDSIREDMIMMTNAYYETARYLLLNNAKKK